MFELFAISTRREMCYPLLTLVLVMGVMVLMRVLSFLLPPREAAASVGPASTETEMECTTKAKAFTIWPFTAKVC